MSFNDAATQSLITSPAAQKGGPPRTPNPVTGPRIIRGPRAEGRGKRISNYALIGAIPLLKAL